MLIRWVEDRTYVFGSRQPTSPASPNSASQLGFGQMAFKTRFVGRMEKRLAIAIVVRLAHDGDQPPSVEELTYTDNVSAHGARVISNRPWKAGDVATVTSLKDESSIRGKVVYCQKHQEGRYFVGLNFLDHRVIWPAYRTYAKS